jgi:hypothetical protein
VKNGDLKPLHADKLSFNIDITLAIQRNIRPTSLVRTFIEALTGKLTILDPEPTNPAPPV